MKLKQRLVVALIAALSVVASASPALAGQGGNPNPDSCGVPVAEAHDFKADPTSPGASEITQYPPVPYGCTGAKK